MLEQSPYSRAALPQKIVVPKLENKQRTKLFMMTRDPPLMLRHKHLDVSPVEQSLIAQPLRRKHVVHQRIKAAL